jgi:hypothetical protein
MAAHGIKFAGFLAEPGCTSSAMKMPPLACTTSTARFRKPRGSGSTPFGRHDVVPDIITTGKPMGNGIPVSGLLAKSEVLAVTTKAPEGITGAAKARLHFIGDENAAIGMHHVHGTDGQWHSGIGPAGQK